MRKDFYQEVKENWKVYVLAIAIPLAAGFLSALITGGGMKAYESLNKPPLSPPGWIFPIVWTILYILMGVSSAMIWLSEDEGRKDALRIYALQLFLNFSWTILFFGLHWYFAAFVWLVVLEALLVVMVAMFFSIRKSAGLLQIPYAVWVAFAAYLNFGTWLLNQ